jgi:tight adherence protein B
MLGLLGALVGTAAAAQDQPDVASRVTAVDASGGRVVASVFTAELDASRVTLREDGTELSAAISTARQRGASTEVIYVVDTANRNVANGVLAGFASAIDDQVAGLPDSVRVGVVRAGTEAQVITRPTTDRSKPGDDVRAVAADLGSSLYDAVLLAARAFGEQPGTIRTVVVLAGGNDDGSSAVVGDLEAVLVQQGAQLVTATVGAPDQGLVQLARRTGGANLVIPPIDEAGAGRGKVDADALGARVETATTLAADRLVLSYLGSADAGPRPAVELELAGQTLSYSYPAGVLTTNVLQLTANEGGTPEPPGLLANPLVLYVSVGLAFLAISAGLWALGSMFAAGESSLDKVLARYSDRDESLQEEDVQEMLVQTALVQRAVAMTESFAERRGFLTRIEEMLERANLPIRAGEAMFFVTLGVVLAGGATFTATSSVFVAAIVSVAIGGISYAALQLAARRRLKAFEAQLPDALQLLAGTLRAGYSLPQGLDAVSVEIADPMGTELRRAITETQLGRELEDALANIAERLDSADFAWAVMAIGIQREVGGNLAEVLITVAETMVQRERLQREVNALTAEGRVSAFILAMMPPGLGVVMYVMNPEYVGVLFSRTIGLALIGLAVVSGLIGLVWMKKVITIDA